MSAQKKAVLASSWSDLPQEIISRIVRRLDSAINVCRLHSVCKNWHYARNPDHRGLLCPFLPRIIANNNLPFTVRQRDTVILVARTVFLVKPLGNPPPSCGWLLTVEEMVPGKLRILYPLSKNRVKHLPSNFPKFLDLSKYQISQVDKSYGLKYDSDKVDVPDVRRVILCSKSNVMVLYGGGTLIRLSLKKGHWRFVWYSINSPFSDVISYGRNNVRAIDRIGNVHVIDHKAARVVKTISPKSLLYKAGPIMLLRSNEDLYVAACVSRNHSPSGYDLIIYRLDEVKLELIDVSYDSYYRRVLFVSCDWRFFLYEYNLDLRHYLPKPKKQQKEEREKVKGDYVIYAEKSFQSLSWYTKVHLYGTTLGIGVFFFDKDDEEYWVKEPRCSSTTVVVLWPPPAWFWPDTYSSSSDDDEELDIQNHTPCNRKHFVPPNKQVSEAKFTAVGSSNTLTIQDLNQNSSTVVFEGINVKSNLIPTLQKIWGKYGNIIEGSIIRNANIIASALESLATTVIILQSNSGHTLSKDQADYMSSALCDLQQMKFNVNWLVPFVEKAIAVHKSRPLINALKDFDKAKAQAEEMKMKVLDELAKLDEVEEDIVFVSERLSGLKSMDFDLILGDGLC
ncbi:uncharacterized protein LOC141652585 isoform X2 [Silene latifolia]|uniref:uncharacterized protein LOC141652585 isoform X2 n=1 Tax=Silene latifolia TaxID=37657 RepID=UPI003D76B663